LTRCGAAGRVGGPEQCDEAWTLYGRYRDRSAGTAIAELRIAVWRQEIADLITFAVDVVLKIGADDDVSFAVNPNRSAKSSAVAGQRDELDAILRRGDILVDLLKQRIAGALVGDRSECYRRSLRCPDRGANATGNVAR